MKCHAGVKFESGKPCPRCGAKLGDVCWPGINADLRELARLQAATKTIIRDASAIMNDANWSGEATEVASRFFKIASEAIALKTAKGESE